MVDDSDGHAATDANTITDAVCINHRVCFCDRFIDSYPAANADADTVSHCLTDSVEFAFGERVCHGDRNDHPAADGDSLCDALCDHHLLNESYAFVDGDATAYPHADTVAVGLLDCIYVAISHHVSHGDGHGHSSGNTDAVSDAIHVAHHIHFRNDVVDCYPAANADADAVSHRLSDSVELAVDHYIGHTHGNDHATADGDSLCDAFLDDHLLNEPHPFVDGDATAYPHADAVAVDVAVTDSHRHSNRFDVADSDSHPAAHTDQDHHSDGFIDTLQYGLGDCFALGDRDDHSAADSNANVNAIEHCQCHRDDERHYHDHPAADTDANHHAFDHSIRDADEVAQRVRYGDYDDHSATDTNRVVDTERHCQRVRDCDSSSNSDTLDDNLSHWHAFAVGIVYAVGNSHADNDAATNGHPDAYAHGVGIDDGDHHATADGHAHAIVVRYADHIRLHIVDHVAVCIGDHHTAADRNANRHVLQHLVGVPLGECDSNPDSAADGHAIAYAVPQHNRIGIRKRHDHRISD
jgi:hypothetical protein